MKQVLTLALILCSNYCFAQERSANMIPYCYDASLSDKNGKPIKANDFKPFAYPNTPYFPVEHFRDTVHWVYDINKRPKEFRFGKVETLHKDCGAETLEQYSIKEKVSINTLRDTLEFKVDTSRLGWFSRDMYHLEEPILYNYPIKTEIIRFILLRSFHPPLAIRLENDNGHYKIYTKEISKNIESPYYKLLDWGKPTQRDSLIEPDNKDIHLTINTSKTITKEQFESVKKLITRSRIKYESHRVRLGCIWGTDGAQWILEIQNKEGYFFIDRHSPKKQTINEVGRMIIKLSGYKGEIY